jgi:hypothetical protein
MLFNRQPRIWRRLEGLLAWNSNFEQKKEIVKKIKEEEQVLSNLEVDRKLVKDLESILFLIGFPFFCIWVIILMPVIVILWIAAKFDKERHTL